MRGREHAAGRSPVEREGRRRRGAAVRAVALAVALTMAVPSWAFALTIDGPEDCGPAAEIGVTAGPADPSGVISLSLDGSVVGTASVGGPGERRTFTMSAMPPGVRTFTAELAGGATLVTATPLTLRSWSLPGAPAWVSPSGGYAAGTTPVRLVPGSSTSSITVSFNEVVIGKATVAGPPAVLDFGAVALPPGVSTFVVTEGNPLGQTVSYPMQVRRLDYPYATCIIIDKSDFRLYWIRDGVLVKAYPIAHGKRRTPTPVAVWRVGLKDKSSPRGVYGPRRLRLFRRVRTRRGWRFRRTGYMVHGTNQPWVIGTMASHGCIRLTNDQILDLWPQVPVGTMVITRK